MGKKPTTKATLLFPKVTTERADVIDGHVLSPLVTGPPRWLPKGAKKWWRILQPVLLERGHLTVVDKSLFGVLCSSYDMVENLSKTLKDMEPGSEIHTSLLLHLKEAQASARALARCFCLLPGATDE